MHLVFSPTLCPDLQLPAALELAKEAGFSRLELFCNWTESSPLHAETSVQMVRARIAAAAFQPSSLNIRNLTGRKADSDERNLPYNLRQLEWDIHLGRALGVETMSTKGGARTDEAVEDLVEGVNTLLERLPQIQLNLGNQLGNRLQDISDYNVVMPQLNARAKVLVDTGHLLAAGENVLAFAETFAERIGLVHLRDQQGEKPVPFGEGDLPFFELFALLKDADYDGDLVIELEQVDWEAPNVALVAAREYVEEMLG
jgi:sugar phosphate isomerase/epimerase